MASNQIYLEPNNFYHIYNRGNACENIFYSNENYNYFFKKYLEYIEPIANTYAYCLMPNHFHLLIKVKSETELFKFLKASGIRKVVEFLNKNETYLPLMPTNLVFVFQKSKLLRYKIPDEKLTQEDFEMMYFNSPPNLYSLHISKQFYNFLNGYSQAINKQQKRLGNLFLKQFKRMSIHDEDYLKNVIVYIHTNAIHHKFVANINDWKFNSYHSIISNLPTKIERTEVINLFEDLDNFIKIHNQKNTFNLEEDFDS